MQINQEKLRSVFAESPIGIELYDAAGRLVDANKSDLELFGISGFQEIKGASIFDDPHIPDDIKTKLHRGESVRFERVYHFGRINRFNLCRSTKSGRMDLDVMITPVGFKKGTTFKGYLAQFQDISVRKRAEAHIRSLPQRLIKAQETERRQISRHLHDSVAQDLSTLKIACENLFDNQPNVSEEIRLCLGEFSRILQNAVRLIRDISYDLHPAMLDKLGLVQAVYQYCKDFSEKTGLKVDFSSAGLDNARLDFDTKINLYRIIQEALNNIGKHAGAGRALIRLVASFPNIILRVEDNGKGFDVNKVSQKTVSGKRMGLRAMEERVGLLNGNFRIQSRPMEGTKLYIEIPYTGPK